MPILPSNIETLFNQFNVPITEIDCGILCAPHNPYRIPFCCDICHAIPAAYKSEWEYLRSNTDLWHLWRGDECKSEPVDPTTIQKDTPEHMVLLACKGYEHCQRSFRSISCRQFPFFPYITSDDRFIGMSYNWDFEPYCWIISHLESVTEVFRTEFFFIYDKLLSTIPEDYDSYYYLSEDMRSHFIKLKRRIPILHRNGDYYLLSPKNERLTKVSPSQFKKFNPYQ